MVVPAACGVTSPDGPPLTLTPAGSASALPLPVESEPIVSDTDSPTSIVAAFGRVEVRKCSGALSSLGQNGPVAKHWAA